MTDTRSRPTAHHAHGHFWIFGLLGLAAGAALMIYAPHLKAVSSSMFFFAGFHLIGAMVIAMSLSTGFLASHFARRRLARAIKTRELNFGWGPGWMNGLGIAAKVAVAGAVLIEIAVPAFWPLALLLVAVAALFVAGNLVMRDFMRQDHAVLPMLDLLRSEKDLVLDAGCGAGRTTIALSRVLKGGHVIAVDRFDAGYIDGGGQALLRHNLDVAGLSERVTVESADLTALQFAEADFDTIVSTHVYDHLGKQKARGLAEAYRVLKPGGRFLMAVWVPGLTMFTVANVMSFFLTPKSAWRAMAKAAGFELVDECVSNHAWFLLMQKPGPRAPAS